MALQRREDEGIETLLISLTKATRGIMSVRYGRSIGCCLFALLMIGHAIAGCAVTPRSAPITVAVKSVVRSYDLLDAVDATAIIRAIEAAFIQTLHLQPKTSQGEVPSSLPSVPPDFEVEHRVMPLDHLGLVDIPHVECPGSLAVIHEITVGGSLSGLNAYAACLYLYQRGYRVRFVSIETDAENHSADPRHSDEPSVEMTQLSVLGQALVQLLPETILIDASEESTLVKGELPSSDEKPLSVPPGLGAVRSAPPRADSPNTKNDQGSQFERPVAAVALACFGPARGATVIRSQDHGEKVLEILSPGALIVVPETLHYAYLQVKTSEGVTGWVRRSDVQRVPCPVG